MVLLTTISTIRGVFGGAGRALMGDAAVVAAVLRLVPSKPQIRLVYLGTATYDLAEFREAQTAAYADTCVHVESLDCACSVPPADAVERALDAADVVMVSGGNTLFALGRWERAGVLAPRDPGVRRRELLGRRACPAVPAQGAGAAGARAMGRGARLFGTVRARAGGAGPERPREAARGAVPRQEVAAQGPVRLARRQGTGVEGEREGDPRGVQESALACHPDRFADADDAAKKEAEAKFKELGEALDILTDEFKRKLWDEGHDLDAIAQRVQMREQQQGRR